jgi:hypothetical protein
MISLPFKLMLFVLVDGWHLICGSLIKSFGASGFFSSVMQVSATAPIIFRKSENRSKTEEIIFMGNPDSFLVLMSIGLSTDRPGEGQWTRG